MNVWLDQTPKEEPWEPTSRETAALPQSSKAISVRQFVGLEDGMRKSTKEMSWIQFLIFLATW